MQIIQIQEPTKSNNTIANSIAVGIDFGTTNSLVAYSVAGIPKMLYDEHNKSKIPSVVAITKEKDIIVGTKAAGLSDSKDIVEIKSIKRLIGKKIEDLDSSVYLRKFIHSNNDKNISLSIHGLSLSVAEISSEILKKIKSIADNGLKADVKNAVITVPAYFDETQRRAVKFSAELAGINVLRIINEPTAAALAYRLDKIENGTYLVYDFGGGTFDVSILKISQGVFKVIATGGDTNLGGDDIDHILAQDLVSKLGHDDVHSLTKYAKQIKEQLSKEQSVNVKIHSDKEHEIIISRDYFESLINDIIQRTLKIVDETISSSDVNKSEISGIILVGGSTRTPMIKRKLSENFSNISFLDSIDPDEVVAMGAAIQAENLTKGSGDLLLDVTPLSLGLELMGGINEKIIHRNSPIPISVSKEFTTHEDGQTGLKLHVLQGERELAEHCRSLATLELLGIPAMKAGVPRVNVTFTIDTDGLLTVSGREKSTGIQQSIDVMPTYGLAYKDIEKALISSIENSEKDHKARVLAESKFYAQEISSKIIHAMREDNDLLSDEEYNSIYARIDDINKAVKGDDRAIVDEAVNALEKSSENFISRKLSKHISIGLKGKKIKDLEDIAN